MVNRLPPGILPMIKYPSPEEVPQWSEDTQDLLAPLTPLERSFVEWHACGMNPAEAYRKVTGYEYPGREADTSRQNAHAIMSRPRVQMALAAALKDMNFDARMNRAWMLERLNIAIQKVEASDKPEHQEIMAKLIEVAGKLKGEIGAKSDGEQSGQPQRVDVHVRVDSVLEGVAALIGQRKGGPPPAIGSGSTSVDVIRVDNAVGSE